MREIKFRFWNAQGMRFHYDQRQVLSCLTNQVCGGYDYTIDDCTFEQFTGLRDKNGREIYEGDIVRFYYDADYGIMDKPEKDGTSTMIDIVEFKDGCFVFTCDLKMSAFANRYARHCEIIGNIHENPELVAKA